MDEAIHEEKIQNHYVNPRPSILTQEKFHKFIPSMENSMAIMGSYTYDSTSKRVSQIIVNNIKINEYVEEKKLK